jgi:hypothetical protein
MERVAVSEKGVGNTLLAQFGDPRKPVLRHGGTMTKSNYPHLREAQRIVWRPECTLSHLARHICAYLLNRMNEDYDGAYPSIARICADTGMGRDSVIRYTQEAVDSGILSRKPGRKGMYRYRLTSMEDIARALDMKLEEWAKEFWEQKRAALLNGRQERPVDGTDRSATPTATGRRDRPVPVDGVDPERPRRKGQGKGRGDAHGAPTPDTPAPVDSDATLRDAAETTPLPPSEDELQGQVAGIAWAEPGEVPERWEWPVHVDTLGRVRFVFSKAGRKAYAELMGAGFTPADIVRAQQTCSPRLSKVSGFRTGSAATAVQAMGVVLSACRFSQEERTKREGWAKPKPKSFAGPTDYRQRDAVLVGSRFK